MRISDWSSDVCSSDLPPNDSVSINDSTSLDLRIEWVKLMMPEWNHLVGFQVIADEGSLPHTCTLTAGGQGFDIKHKIHFRLRNTCRGGRRFRRGSCGKRLCHLVWPS